MRDALLSENNAGKTADPTLAKIAPWQRSAASTAGGAASSSTRGEWSTSSKTDTWNAESPAQKPPLPCKAGAQKEQDSKRRRKSALASSRPGSKPSIAVLPGEDIAPPEDIAVAFGWTKDNIVLFEEWRIYFGKLAQSGSLVTEADCSFILAEKSKLLADAQTSSDNRKAAFLCTAPQRGSNRNTPIGLKAATGIDPEVKQD